MLIPTYKVPFLDLKRQHLKLDKKIRQKIESVSKSGNYILSAQVQLFEQNFSKYCGVSAAAGVASGTDALMLALKACGVSRGDEVLTVANTCMPTITAIQMLGAKPVLVDIESDSMTMNPDCLASAITKKTKAIVPVHLYGQLCQMAPILKIAKKNGLSVVEDCAQAHGAGDGTQKAGSFGDLAAFSFYPTKNLGAVGDGGAVVGPKSSTIKKIKHLRNYGQKIRYYHEDEGINSRLDEIQAAILSAKLPYLDAWNTRRKAIASQYQKAFSELPILCPRPADSYSHVFHLYVVRVQRRNNFLKKMQKKGIQTLVHYPSLMHQQPAFKGRVASSGLAETIKANQAIVSLPLYPEMTSGEIRCVIQAVRESV